VLNNQRTRPCIRLRFQHPQGARNITWIPTIRSCPYDTERRKAAGPSTSGDAAVAVFYTAGTSTDLDFVSLTDIRNLSRLTASHDIVRLHAKKTDRSVSNKASLANCLQAGVLVTNRREMSNVAPATWCTHGHRGDVMMARSVRTTAV
jgi:hypothetical protein